jgi:hypothetical protein
MDSELLKKIQTRYCKMEREETTNPMRTTPLQYHWSLQQQKIIHYTHPPLEYPRLHVAQCRSPPPLQASQPPPDRSSPWRSCRSVSIKGMVPRNSTPMRRIPCFTFKYSSSHSSLKGPKLFCGNRSLFHGPLLLRHAKFTTMEQNTHPIWWNRPGQAHSQLLTSVASLILPVGYSITILSMRKMKGMSS